MSEMIAISNTSTMYQLAFGLNVVAGYLLINFFSAREEIWKKFHGLSKKHLPSEELESINLYKALLATFPKFKILNEVFILAVILYSIISVIVCFAQLALAAVEPEKQINSIVFLFLITILVLVNPIGYYLFNKYYKEQISLKLELLERFSKQEFEIIAHLAKGLDHNEASDDLVKEINKQARAIKYNSYKFHILGVSQKVKDLLSVIRGKLKGSE